jgi:hypothetical protein
LQFIWIPDTLALRLEAKRKISFGLKVGRHDLAQSFRGRERDVRGRKTTDHGQKGRSDRTSELHEMELLNR